MKIIQSLLLISISFLGACQYESIQGLHENKLNDNIYYVEGKLSFFDPNEVIYENFRFTGNTYNHWIRTPQNLRMIHETFKKIGYQRLFEFHNYSENCGFIHDVNKPCDVLIDSLIQTYPLDTIQSKYYRDFWNRRKEEHNDSIVYQIVNEVSQIMYQNTPISFDSGLANDTLYRLLEIRDFTDSVTNTQALNNFNYLKSIGLHSSAYNLLYKRRMYANIDWDKENLKSSLKTDTANCCPFSFLIGNTK